MKREDMEQVFDSKYLRVFDLQKEAGTHYYNATRRDLEHVVAAKSKEEFKAMLPDAVTCIVILDKPGEDAKLLMSYEYRYPVGQYLLSPPAGLIDPEDCGEGDPVLTAAVRELEEETGLKPTEKDTVKTVNHLLFSTPGMTDESNALVCVVLHDLKGLTQEGAVGAERFDGFAFINKNQAKELLKNGCDQNGIFYSVYTWAALVYFATDLWKSEE